MEKIILASASPRRKDLLLSINIPFECVKSNADESMKDIIGEPGFKAEQIALKKASSVAKNFSNGIILGADTIVVIDDMILGKPKDDNDAFQMLSKLSGRYHEVITGVAIISLNNNIQVINHETTKVKFRELSSDTIKAYIKSGEFQDKAGAYAIQGLGALLVEEIQGSFSNVVGLPIVTLDKMLKKIGINIL